MERALVHMVTTARPDSSGLGWATNVTFSNRDGGGWAAALPSGSLAAPAPAASPASPCRGPQVAAGEEEDLVTTPSLL